MNDTPFLEGRSTNRLDYINSLEIGRNGNTEDFIRLVAEIENETLKDFGRYMNIDFKINSNPEHTDELNRNN